MYKPSYTTFVDPFTYEISTLFKSSTLNFSYCCTYDYLFTNYYLSPDQLIGRFNYLIIIISKHPLMQIINKYPPAEMFFVSLIYGIK